MVLKGLGVVFIVIVAVAFSVGDSGTSGTEAEYLYLIVPNSDVIINPGSKEVLTVIPKYIYSSNLKSVKNPVKKNVSVTFTLSDPGERPLCLSKEGDKGTDSDCSSCSVTIQGTESFSLVISYSRPVNEAFIEKDKVFHLDVSNDLHIPTVKLQGGITITAKDSRSKYLTLLNKDSHFQSCMVCSNLFPVSAPHTICKALVGYGAWLDELTE